MIKNKINFVIATLIILIMTISNFAFATEVIIDEDNRFHELPSYSIPEMHINFKIENLTRGCKVYMLLPENMLKYNMEKYVSNNIQNPYEISAREAREQEKFLQKSDYLGYIEYALDKGYEVDDNEIEIRHYCMCMGKSSVIDYFEYKDVKYIQIELNMNNENEFKLILKDYLTTYDTNDLKFMIDEYGTRTYIGIDSVPYTQSLDSSMITERNVLHTYYTMEDYETIEKSINTAYAIVYTILILIAILVIILIIRHEIKKKREKEARKFWKKPLTKEEKKFLKKKKKEEKKEAKKNKKKK